MITAKESRRTFFRLLPLGVVVMTVPWLSGRVKVERVALAVPSGITVLDAASFVEASRTPDFLDRLSPIAGPTLRLEAYAVTRIRL